ncbi:hypothetical protein BHE74_00039752 [Ensete ventricosum]|nr:hypothetical protein BHE74_00039752 [Ensete ventricosum]
MRRAQARLKKTLNPRTARSAHLTREIKTEAFATELPPTNRNTAAASTTRSKYKKSELLLLVFCLDDITDFGAQEKRGRGILTSSGAQFERKASERERERERNREKRTGWVSFSGGSESDGNERYAVKEVDASRRLALDFATVVHVPFPPSPFLLYPNGQDKREAGERQVGF